MNKEVVGQNLLTEYMLLQHKYSMLLKSLGCRHPTDEDIERLDKMKHRLEVLREVFKQEALELPFILSVIKYPNV